MKKDEIYRLKGGKLTESTSKTLIPIYFGVVFSSNGVVKIDLYVNESFNLEEYINKNEKLLNRFFTLKSNTVENDSLEIDRLAFHKVSPHLGIINMVSFGKMTHTKIDDRKNSSHDKVNSKLHYLVLEGLNIQYSDITSNVKKRGGQQVNKYADWERDHTNTLLVVETFPYNQIFSKSTENNDVIVTFPDESQNTLRYQNFLNFRENYVAALSLLNGAEVKIRKECTGEYYSLNKVDSEIVITYSFPKIEHSRFNKYIPINSAFSRSENILNNFFIHCFNNYQSWAKKIDLNSIIFHLNGAERVSNYEERTFIHMIAFERLSSLYAEFLGEEEQFNPSVEVFNPIKEKLVEVIELNKDLLEDAYPVIKSRVCNLNQIKRQSTKFKMFKIIQDVEIPLTPKLTDLVNTVRNKTIHHGDIGTGNDGIINSYLLDELIRETVLRLVEYKGSRDSQILLPDV